MNVLFVLVSLFLAFTGGYMVGWSHSSAEWRDWCHTGICYSAQVPPR